MNLPPCEKCGSALKEDLICKPCGREYTEYWLKLKRNGER